MKCNNCVFELFWNGWTTTLWVELCFYIGKTAKPDITPPTCGDIEFLEGSVRVGTTSLPEENDYRPIKLF